MRTRLTILLFMFMAACTSIPAQQSTTVSTTQALAPTPPPLTELSPSPESATAYPDLGPAPEFVGEVWLNTDASLRLADLRGKVILIDMWTYG